MRVPARRLCIVCLKSDSTVASMGWIQHGIQYLSNFGSLSVGNTISLLKPGFSPITNLRAFLYSHLTVVFVSNRNTQMSPTRTSSTSLDNSKRINAPPP